MQGFMTQQQERSSLSCGLTLQGDNEACADVYQGAVFQWTHITNQRANTTMSYDNTNNDEKHSFQLRVHRKHRRLVQQYLAHVNLSATEEEKRNRQLLVRMCTPAM